MQDKLQELTQQLYNEGLAKGKAEGEALLAQARKEASSILEQARGEAARITSEAEKSAEDLRQKVESDLKTASGQVLTATRQDIEKLLSGALADVKFLEKPDFLKEIIKTVAGRFDSAEAQDLSLVLPERLRAELEPWAAGELTKSLKKGVSVEFSKKSAGGFSIGPKGGDWFIDLGEESFKALMAEYLRPVTRKLLFGE